MALQGFMLFQHSRSRAGNSLLEQPANNPISQWQFPCCPPTELEMTVFNGVNSECSDPVS